MLHLLLQRFLWINSICLSSLASKATKSYARISWAATLLGTIRSNKPIIRNAHALTTKSIEPITIFKDLHYLVVRTPKRMIKTSARAGMLWRHKSQAQG